MGELDLLILSVLFFTGGLAFTISTLSGGGGAMMSLPVVAWLIGPQFTAPVVNLGTFIGRPSRLALFWTSIDWKVVKVYAPSAALGSWLAAWGFDQLNVQWIRLVLGLFLVSTLLQYKLGKKARSFTMRLSYFAPLGLVISVLVTWVGALGPILNPFYLNYGLEKEDLIATKTANAFILGFVQLGGYSFFGLLSGVYWWYGIALGLGALLGNVIGKRFLQKIQATTFRKLLIAFMVISGLLMLVRSVPQVLSAFF